MIQTDFNRMQLQQFMSLSGTKCQYEATKIVPPGGYGPIALPPVTLLSSWDVSTEFYFTTNFQLT